MLFKNGVTSNYMFAAYLQMTLFQIVNKRKYSLIIMELFELVLLHKNLWLFFMRLKFADFPVPQITHVPYSVRDSAW